MVQVGVSGSNASNASRSHACDKYNAIDFSSSAEGQRILVAKMSVNSSHLLSHLADGPWVPSWKKKGVQQI